MHTTVIYNFGLVSRRHFLNVYRCGDSTNIFDQYFIWIDKTM